MQGIELLGVGSVLLGTLGIGMVAHELTHAAVLHVLGVPYEISWFPGRAADNALGAGLLGTWATVTPCRTPHDVSPRGLQLSAMAPLALAAPLLLVPLGLLPDPLTAHAAATAATVAWLGCALPSPQDFSLFWYADRIVADDGSSPVER